MDWHSIIVRSPINKTAGRVVAQARDRAADGDLTRDELIEIVARLQRKHKLLKHVIGVKNKSQHSNLMWKFGKGMKQYRAKNEPRAFLEYVRIGHETQRLILRIKEIKAAMRLERGPECAGGCVKVDRPCGGRCSLLCGGSM